MNVIILFDEREKLNKKFYQYIKQKYYINYLFNKGLLNESQVEKIKVRIAKLYNSK